MDEVFMLRLQRLRDAWGYPFSAVEGGGYRCADYNGSPDGAHVQGRAIDPTISRLSYYHFIKLAMELGFTGIGVKSKRDENGKPTFQLHLDDLQAGEGKTRPFLWTY